MSWKTRFIFWGSFLGLIVGGYYFQPIRFEFFPPEAPTQARVSPEEAGLLTPGARVLVVTGHPDDSEFYLGGTLLKMAAAGVRVRVVAMTDGDKAYYPFGVPEGLTETRRGEQRRAADVWKGDAVFLGFRDGRLPVNDETVRALLKEIERFQPDVVMCFDATYRSRSSHSDHIDAGRNAMRALAKWSGSCTVALFATRAPNCFVDIDKQWFGKRDLIALHASQFQGERLGLITGFLADKALMDGAASGLEMAESFRVYRHE